MRRDNRNSSGQQRNKNHFQSMYDKYYTAAKESLLSGDEIGYQKNLQHAEHFVRMMNGRLQEQQAKQQKAQQAESPKLDNEKRSTRSKVKNVDVEVLSENAIEKPEDKIMENPVRKRTVRRAPREKAVSAEKKAVPNNVVGVEA